MGEDVPTCGHASTRRRHPRGACRSRRIPRASFCFVLLLRASFWGATLVRASVRPRFFFTGKRDFPVRGSCLPVRLFSCMFTSSVQQSVLFLESCLREPRTGELGTTTRA